MPVAWLAAGSGPDPMMMALSWCAGAGVANEIDEAFERAHGLAMTLEPLAGKRRACPVLEAGCPRR